MKEFKSIKLKCHLIFILSYEFSYMICIIPLILSFYLRQGFVFVCLFFYFLLLL